MKLYRVASVSDSIKNILALLPDAKKHTAIAKLIDSKSMIEEVFSRKIPMVDRRFESRFISEQIRRNGLYSSESPVTARYEYGFHLLRDTTIYGMSVYSSLYNLELVADPSLVVDITYDIDIQNIMSRDSYQYSHQFIHNIEPDRLSVIKYPNVRDINRGASNYICYSKDYLAVAGVAPGVMVYKAIDAANVEVRSLDGDVETISPIR